MLTLLTAAVAGGIGFYAGRASGLRHVHAQQEAAAEKVVVVGEAEAEKQEAAKDPKKEHEGKSDEEWESSDDDDDDTDGINSFPDSGEDCKMVTGGLPLPLFCLVHDPGLADGMEGKNRCSAFAPTSA